MLDESRELPSGEGNGEVVRHRDEIGTSCDFWGFQLRRPLLQDGRAIDDACAEDGTACQSPEATNREQPYVTFVINSYCRCRKWF